MAILGKIMAGLAGLHCHLVIFSKRRRFFRICVARFIIRARRHCRKHKTGTTEAPLHLQVYHRRLEMPLLIDHGEECLRGEQDPLGIAPSLVRVRNYSQKDLLPFLRSHSWGAART